MSLSTGFLVRSAARSNFLTKNTSGTAPGHIQANLIILPSQYATDFRNLCLRNPVPCPLLAESPPGQYDTLISHQFSSTALISHSLDIRTDCPRYMVYTDGCLTKSHVPDISAEWSADHVAFLIGCSYSFETELAAAGLPARHVTLGRNVAIYRTTLALCPAGVFTRGTYVVSMRPYKRCEIDRVRQITRRYAATHGEPIAWGWDALAALGISDIDAPEWGDAPLTLAGEPLGARRGDDNEMPVFWGCGVTPQEVVAQAKLRGVAMAHAPGHMLVLDARDQDLI
ncbi:hypothetical protein TD95_005126 [Thielaviopsis punctulata]|uniref:DUF1445 domain-containing protein n=1 Tax=Thielaviopsis punctulata TaxID=72032 RepID=A0A0F4ZK60_9PEZI|nr:hypothetical protein TD95_005126 [Thielaviopsis punctulata]